MVNRHEKIRDIFLACLLRSGRTGLGSFVLPPPAAGQIDEAQPWVLLRPIV